MAFLSASHAVISALQIQTAFSMRLIKLIKVLVGQCPAKSNQPLTRHRNFQAGVLHQTMQAIGPTGPSSGFPYLIFI